MEFRSRLLGTVRAVAPLFEVPGVMVVGSEVPNLLGPRAASTLVVSRHVDLAIPVTEVTAVKQRLPALSGLAPSPEEPSVWLPSGPELLEVNFLGLDHTIQESGESYVADDLELPLLVFGLLSLLEPGPPVVVGDLSVPVPRVSGLLLEKLATERTGEKGDRDLLVALGLLIVAKPSDLDELVARFGRLPGELRHTVLVNRALLALHEPREGTIITAEAARANSRRRASRGIPARILLTSRSRRRPTGMRRMTTLLALFAAMAAGAEDRFTYIYRPDGHARALHLRGSITALEHVQEKLETGPYLWVRLDGREFVIRDSAVLAELAKTFAPLDALDQDQRALDRKMKPFEARAAQLEEQIDRLTDSEEELSAKDERKLRDLEKQLRGVQHELRIFEKDVGELEHREVSVEGVVEEAVRGIAARAIRQGIAARFR